MTDDLREAAAKAIAGSFGGQLWGVLPEEQDAWRKEAEAAICVVLTHPPTEAMICAGDEEIINALNEHPRDVEFKNGTPAERCYQAMMRAALAERGA